MDKSLLAKMLESSIDEKREEIISTPIEVILQQEMEEVGLYVYLSILDYTNGSEMTGSIEVASDGMPERAKTAVEEVLRAQGITEYDWWDNPMPGRVGLCWEVMDEPEAKEVE